MNRDWVVFNAFRTAEGLWLHVYVRARDADHAIELAYPVFRYMATKHMPPDAILRAGKFLDKSLWTAFCVEQDLDA